MIMPSLRKSRISRRRIDNKSQVFGAWCWSFLKPQTVPVELAMPASEPLTDTPRSSTRSKHAKASQFAAAESPLSKVQAQEILTADKADQSQINGTASKEISTKSRKRVKAKAVVAKREVRSPVKAKLRKEIKQEALKEQTGHQGVPEVAAITKETPRNRKVKEEEEEEEIQLKGDRTAKTKRKRVAEVEKVDAENSGPSPKKTKQKKITQVEEQEDPVDSGSSLKKPSRKTILKAEEEEDVEEGEEGTKKIKRKRKTKEEKEAEAMPLAARTNGLRKFVGAHVSCAKGVQNSVTNCVHIGGNAFAMFLKSQRKWENPPLQDEHKDLFIASCSDHKYDAASHVLPHGSYLVNLAQEEREKADQAYNAFLDDLHRCEALGIKLYNFHPGSTGNHPRPSAIARIASALNRAHKGTKTVIPVLETMAGGGNVIGSTFDDLRDIIAQVDDKTRIGVCIDTCHIFAAGYDLGTPTAFAETLRKFDEIVGMKYLRAIHLNDSKAPFGSHRDLHQNIGLGFLGLRAFHNVMNEPRFEGIPIVLETPIDRKDEETGKEIEDKGVWAREIKMLEEFIGMDAECDEFKALEKELADKGAEERKKLQDVYDRKVEKDKKALEKGQQKLNFGGKRKSKKADHGSDSEA